MKNKLLAGLMAVCCMQSGFALTAYADELESDEPQINETESDNPPEMKIPFDAGDVDLNHEVNILDVILLNRVVLGKEVLSDLQAVVADVNQDDKIDAVDSLCILKMLVGIYDMEVY